MKKLVVVLCLTLMLAACSSRPKSFTGAHHERPQKVNELVGQTRNQITRIMGTPVTTRTEGDYTLWSYKTGSCATLIYFDKSGKVKYAETRGNCAQSDHS